MSRIIFLTSYISHLHTHLHNILIYIFSNCFFFALNSSSVITPISSNSLNFFSSSATEIVALP
ncbi:hypothetical protein ADK17_15210 [Bacillus anthracis]|nr:hypothetical protein ADK17_15210 [Bacillus anthracis]